MVKGEEEEFSTFLMSLNDLFLLRAGGRGWAQPCISELWLSPWCVPVPGRDIGLALPLRLGHARKEARPESLESLCSISPSSDHSVCNVKRKKNPVHETDLPFLGNTPLERSPGDTGTLV